MIPIVNTALFPLCVQVCQNVIKCYAVAAQFEGCRDRITEIPAIIKDLCRALYFKVSICNYPSETNRQNKTRNKYQLTELLTLISKKEYMVRPEAFHCHTFYHHGNLQRIDIDCFEGHG